MAVIFQKRVSKRRQFLLILFIVGMVSGICFIASPFLGYRVVAFVLLVTVSIIAMFFDILPVLLAAFLSALIWDFLFIPPRYTFLIGSAEDTFLLSMYFIIALINAVLTYKLRQIEKLNRAQELKMKEIKLYNLLMNSLSHELKTPIAAIMGASDNLLLDSEKLSDKNRLALAAQISVASMRLNQQVENLLNMSRLETGHVKLKKDWCDVKELIYSVVNEFDDKIKNHEFKIEVNEKLPLFRLDYVVMQQVLRNLIINAVLYTPAGSEISISADCTSEIKGHFVTDHDKWQPHRDAVKKLLVLDVSDNGTGIPADEIGNVFDKFYRLKNSKPGGTGLGLSIVKGFVEAHHGTIMLSNSVHGGAKFTIRIPAETEIITNLVR